MIFIIIYNFIILYFYNNFYFYYFLFVENIEINIFDYVHNPHKFLVAMLQLIVSFKLILKVEFIFSF